MIQLHGVPSIGEGRQVRKQDQITREVHAFIETYKEAAHMKDMPITRENITCYVVELESLYTKLVTLNNQAHAKWNSLISYALVCLHRNAKDQP